jgi:hypothetical protein
MKYLCLFESFVDVDDISDAVKDTFQDLVDDKGFSCNTQVVNIQMSKDNKLEKTLSCVISKPSHTVEGHTLHSNFNWEEISDEVKSAIGYLKDAFELNDYEISVYYKDRHRRDKFIKGDVEKIDPIIRNLIVSGAEEKLEITRVSVNLMFYTDNSGLFRQQTV